jgi:hypothetical protein
MDEKLNEASQGRVAPRWLPGAAFALSVGALLATLLLFAILAGATDADPAPPPAALTVVWLFFSLFCSLLPVACIWRLRLLHSVFVSGARHDEAAWDVFFAAAAAILMMLALVAAMSSGSPHAFNLWLAVGLGTIGLVPLAAVRARLIGRREG